MKKLIAYLITTLIATPVISQSTYPVTYSLPDKIEAKPSSTFTITTTFKADAPWYIYAPTGSNAAQGMIETTIIYNLPKGITKKGKIQLPKSHYKGGFEIYDGKEIKFKQEFTVSKELAPGEYTIKGKINYQTCNEEICLPPMQDEISITVIVKDASAIAQHDSAALQLQFTSLDGKFIDLANLKGKLVLIDCWATWCRPCIAEFANLKKLYAKYKSKGFEVIGISMDEATSKQRAKDLIKKNALPWPQWFEGKGFNNNSFVIQQNIASLPTVFLIDRQGNIIDKDARGERLEELIKQYL